MTVGNPRNYQQHAVYERVFCSIIPQRTKDKLPLTKQGLYDTDNTFLPPPLHSHLQPTVYIPLFICTDHHKVCGFILIVFNYREFCNQ